MTRRQALTDAVNAAAAAFANQLADAIVSYALAGPDTEAERPRVRRRPARAFVPQRALPSSDAFDKATAAARRAGVR